MASDGDRYRWAQAHKMTRLGLVVKDGDGNLRPTAAMDEMDPGPITPDAVDLDAAAEHFRLRG